MMNTIFTSHRVANLGKAFDAFMRHHPFFGFCAIFLGMPIVILLALVLCTSAIVFPMTWVMDLL